MPYLVTVLINNLAGTSIDSYARIAILSLASDLNTIWRAGENARPVLARRIRSGCLEKVEDAAADRIRCGLPRGGACSLPGIAGIPGTRSGQRPDPGEHARSL